MATYTGGTGNDSLTGSIFTDDIYGGAGNDTINANSGDDTVYGGDGADSINAGSGADLVFAEGGNDTVTASTGYDTIFGGTGNDNLSGGSDMWDDLYGGTGDDSLYGGSFGQNWVYGGDGNDLVYGGAGSGDIASGGSGRDTVYGGLGDDFVRGGTGNDLATGDDGNDAVDGGTGNDTVEGGQGHDSLIGGDGADVIRGDIGSFNPANFASGAATTPTTVVFTNTSSLTVKLFFIDSSGTPQLYATLTPGQSFSANTFVEHNWMLSDAATNSNLAIYEGGVAQSHTYAEAFNDTISGGQGADTIYGDYGDDNINAGTENDQVFGGIGNDSVIGGWGDDTADLGAGNDSFGSWNDEGGNDTVYGGTGDDSIIGGGDNDLLYGGDGNDSLYGGAGNDSSYGGAGNDVGGVTDDHNTDFYDLGENTGDFDIMSFGNWASTNGVSVTFTGNDAGSYAFSGGYATGSFTGVEAISATDYNDTINAASDTDGATIWGNAGSDSITTGSGNDLIDGGTGNDTIVFGAGNDSVYGGDGDDSIDDNLGGWVVGDTYIEAGAGNDTVYGGDGNDQIDDHGAGMLTGASFLSGDGGDDTIWAGGSNDSLYGGSGNDLLYGEGDNDLLDGGSGNDTLWGGDGNDTLDGGQGADYLSGDAGDDTITLTTADFANDVAYGGSGNDTLTSRIDLDGGSDTLYGGDGRDLFTAGANDSIVGGEGGDDFDIIDLSTSPIGGTVTLTGNGTGTITGGGATLTFTEIEAITGSAQSDLIYGGADTWGMTYASGAGNDTVFGGSGADSILSGDGNDSIDGNAGNDTIAAGAGNDTVYGGHGNDSVAGDAGNDVLFGGTGDQVGTTYIQNGGFDDWSAHWSGTEIEAYATEASYLGNGSSNHVSEMDGAAGTTVMEQSFEVQGGQSATLDLRAALRTGAQSGTDGFRVDVLDSQGNVISTMNVLPGSVAWQSYSMPVTFPSDGTYTLRLTELNPSGTSTIGAIVDDIQITATAVAEAGDDTLSGGDGDDTFDGGTGNDTLIGGAGDDTVIFTGPVTDYSFDYVVGGGLQVTDSVPGRDGTDTLTEVEYVTFGGTTYRLVTGDDGTNTTLQGPAGEPALIIAHDGNDWGGGHATSDAIFGGAGNDTLDGGDGNDTLVGDGDDDLLRGDGGNDAIFGGTGNDTLQGGAGDDALTGGNGFDVFDLIEAGGGDTITDFDMSFAGGQTTDQLDVSALQNSDDSPVKTWDVTVADDGSGNTLLTFPQGESVLLQGVDPASVQQPDMLAAMGVPCFGAGTRISTPKGLVAVERLRPGDLVTLADGGAVPILWAGHRHLTAADLAARPSHRPIRIRAGQHGAVRDLILSPQHAVEIPSARALIRAGHLARLNWAARQALGVKEVTYHHILMPRHAIILAEGVRVETLFPGRLALAGFLPADRAALLAVIAAHTPAGPGQSPIESYGPRCLPLLSLAAAIRLKAHRSSPHVILKNQSRQVAAPLALSPAF